MSTVYYLTNTNEPISSDTSLTSTLARLLSQTRGSGVVSGAVNTNASLSTAPENDHNSNWDGSASTIATQPWGPSGGPNSQSNLTANNATGALWFVTKPLNAVTISTAPTANLRALESSTMANYGVGIIFFLINGSGGNAGFRTIFASGSNTTELGTTEGALTVTSAFISGVSSQAIVAGDRLAVMAVFQAAGGTSASGFTATGFWAGTSSAASGDSFVTYSETITEQSAAASVPFRDPYLQLLAQ